MDGRPSTRCASLAQFGLLLAAVGLSTGCTGGLFTVAYLINGNNTPAECKLLKEKKVVVVCRSVVELQYRNAHVERDIAEQVSVLLKKNVSKIKIIDQRKVNRLIDEKQLDEFLDIGKALEAEMVVGLELEQFQLYQGQTLYQGRATVEMKVVDCKTGDIVFKKRLPKVYPPNRVIATSEKQEYEFRTEFVRVLSDFIARHFYDHDPYADFAQDAQSMD